jgi:YHS domain-containing protein
MPRTLASALFTLALLVPALALAQHRVNDNGTGAAIGGYDVVAYFTDHRAVVGSAEHTLVHDGVVYRFASDAHLELFRASPARYLPQYGGFCAYAASQGRLVRVDPDAWRIVDGRLYLNYSHDIQAQWESDRARYIREADERWPALSR